jgi:hypothetical protein
MFTLFDHKNPIVQLFLLIHEHTGSVSTATAASFSSLPHSNSMASILRRFGVSCYPAAKAASSIPALSATYTS